MPSPRDERPKLQRTYSDPDLPSLLPLPVRPASASDIRPKVKVAQQFSTEVLDAMAGKLGLDVELNPEFRWVIRDCLLSLREEGWSVNVREGVVEYAYKYSDSTRTDHEIVKDHREMATRLVAVQRDLKMQHLDPLYRVKHLVYMAVMGETDVRRVNTPKLLEEVLENVGVSAHDEPFLIQRIKVSIEDAYFRMKKDGPHKTTIENCIDCDSLLVNLDLDRVGFMKKISPSGLLYCVECQTSLGDVISTGCHDVLCNACAAETHSRGNRQDVPLVFIEQAVCAECESKAAIVRCQDCVELFCRDCFKKAHARGKRQKHCVGLPQRTFCFECDSREASYICVECEDAMCTRCSSKIHRYGARQNHTLFGLRKAAYNKKLFADNIDRLISILQNNVERSYSLSPWVLFYDSALAPSWYNFQSHSLERADPHKLTTPPVQPNDEVQLGRSMMGKSLSPDQQILRGLPGSTLLQGTHVAEYAAQSACFDVPPPIHLKFQSPIR